MSGTISIKGAREHNLANIDINIPKNKLIVISGVSGSGKSSLAFNTIYAMAQRQYLESMSNHAKQFLDKLQPPELDSISGLSPAIAIEQKTLQSSPRSTVGTLTGIYDYLRVLFARAGRPYCEKHKKYAQKHTIESIAKSVLKLPHKTKLSVLIPIYEISSNENVAKRTQRYYDKIFTRIRKEGFVRVRVNKRTFLLEEEIDILPEDIQSAEIVFDRLIIKDDIAQRLTEALEKAVAFGKGAARLLIEYNDGSQEERIVSEKFSCDECQIDLPELEPSLFSFNTPHGACQRCHGLGSVMELDLDLVIPNRQKTIAQGAIAPLNLNRKMFAKFRGGIKRLCEDYSQNYSSHWEEFPEWFQQIILYGESIEIKHSKIEKRKRKKKFEGVFAYLDRRYHQTESAKMRQALAEFMHEGICSECGGTRLNNYARSVRFAGKPITELTAMSLTALQRFFAYVKIEPVFEEIAAPLIKQIVNRLNFLLDNGVAYLTLSREASSLSGGETQRIKLASQLGSGLSGIIYVLDEPSIGLHHKDIARLIGNLRSLRDLGNTVIVVEHDEQIIKCADYVIDMGPAAGVHGGQIIAQGTPMAVAKVDDSLTGQLISGNLNLEIEKKLVVAEEKFLTITDVTQNNLKNISVQFALGRLNCVTGVSGSGKSSLIMQTLYPALARAINNNFTLKQGAFGKLLGLENIDKVVCIDQKSLSKSPRSNPATFSGVLTGLRELYASLPEAKMRGWTASRFSFNIKGGRCETCKGDGAIRTEMLFLPDVFVECADCRGKRYNQTTLEIQYKGLSIADALDLTIEDAFVIFKNHRTIANKLETLCDVGLGYLRLGQSTDTLSGGEAQRLKLSAELAKRQTGKTLYILDEPTTGLHAVDIKRLLEILRKLVAYGNTVILIEHNLAVINNADHTLELGPEGGDAGGHLLKF